MRSKGKGTLKKMKISPSNQRYQARKDSWGWVDRSSKKGGKMEDRWSLEKGGKGQLERRGQILRPRSPHLSIPARGIEMIIKRDRRPSMQL